jgi:hypothetical protein
LTDLIATYQPDLVVVKLYLSCERISKDHSRAQLASAKAAGKQTAGYVWGYSDFDPRQTVREAADLVLECRVNSPLIFLDCESYEGDPGPDAYWLDRAFGEYVRLGYPPAMYSAAWWLNADLRRLSAVRGVLKWLADYNGIADLASVSLPPGIERAEICGHQFLADPVDRSVFDSRVLA